MLDYLVNTMPQWSFYQAFVLNRDLFYLDHLEVLRRGLSDQTLLTEVWDIFVSYPVDMHPRMGNIFGHEIYC